MDIRSSELTKYAANAMLATKISFMNELSNIAERLGADIEKVRVGIGSDPRIGYSFIYPGTGYGGSCFPKDVQALIRSAHEVGHTPGILDAVESVNNRQKEVLVHKMKRHFSDQLKGKTIALWGLAFKPNTDDMREAPSRVVIDVLLRAGAKVVAHDPIAVEETRRVLQLDFADAPSLLDRISFCSPKDPMSALDGADALVIVTEWKAYRSPNLERLKSLMKSPVIFDGRNLYEPSTMKEAGIVYQGIGRNSF
jgi:UDPglucose 6-dehydrogenase